MCIRDRVWGLQIPSPGGEGEILKRSRIELSGFQTYCIYLHSGRLDSVLDFLQRSLAGGVPAVGQQEEVAEGAGRSGLQRLQGGQNGVIQGRFQGGLKVICLLYTSPS